ncbi:IreB family regulatory phosphoprotein [Schnuerera sp. xch1]|uniref:IreB family regulatory phosphoprotein n=1 Tax=Schnuerera sp. xch1 TaxID=2874283 RepID=UPI0029585BFD|nr:IreB family regulatory phosphoprotein [Schnuerera sp. xch1]MBZ2173711.1 IreB family regulatory phosphoprotein [Schnuerera sp. xch1]
MSNNFNETMKFEASKENINEAKKIIFTVYNALKEKGYDPINQIIGYILSGDPTYITSYKDARSLVRKIERDELLEEILSNYLEKENEF